VAEDARQSPRSIASTMGRTRRRIIKGKVTMNRWIRVVAVRAGAAKPDVTSADALIQFLSSPASAPVIRKKGMEPG
jgi:hypothetical protein